MPYPYTHHAAGFVLVAILIAFWPSYFGSIGEAPFAFHAHAVIATAWVLLVALQSWSIHHRRISLHRTCGRASLVLFPLLTATLVMIMDVSATVYAQGDAYYAVVGPVFGIATLVALIAYLVLIPFALRNRRNARLHGGFMVATLFLLWEPAASRLLVGFVEPFAIEGPADFGKIDDVIALGSAMVVPIGIWLYAKNREHGAPFLIGTVFLVAQIAAVYLVADTGIWRRAFASYADWTPVLSASAGLVIGAIAVWIGWRNPKARQVEAVPIA
ncbi:MAG: hypothetical protein ACNS61_00375 [Candidatus Wenzhouxiangella sp. M2_3B_020]